MTQKLFDKTVTEVGRQEMSDEIKKIAQWVIDNRYPKSEDNKVSDSELYHGIVDKINETISALEQWVKEAEIIINGVNNLRDIIEIKEATQEHEGEAQAVYKLLSDVDSYLSQTKQ